jgi:type IV pilus assembly protein PilX
MKIEGNNARPPRGNQRGAVLVVGLILLMVLTVLGVSSMNTATLELAMAGNTQYHQQAFQAAESGIDISIAQRNFNTAGPAVVPLTPLGDSITTGGSGMGGMGGTTTYAYYTEAVSTFMENTPVPNDAFSMGVSTGSVQAFHFDIVAIGRGPGNAVSTHNQSFYIVGPGG